MTTAVTHAAKKVVGVFDAPVMMFFFFFSPDACGRRAFATLGESKFPQRPRREGERSGGDARSPPPPWSFLFNRCRVVSRLEICEVSALSQHLACAL